MQWTDHVIHTGAITACETSVMSHGLLSTYFCLGHLLNIYVLHKQKCAFRLCGRIYTDVVSSGPSVQILLVTGSHRNTHSNIKTMWTDLKAISI